MNMSRSIKSLLLSIACLCAIACGTKKHTVDSTKAVQQQEAGAGYSTGRITTNFAGDGCAILIKLDGVGNTYLLPIALEEKFKKNGLQLRFKYRPSKASSGDCLKGQPAILEEISVVPIERMRPRAQDQ